MVITKLEALGKNRSRVFIDEELAFVLYRGELSRYQIREGEELSEANYREITEVVLKKRARLRCMNLLKSRDRTEYQLRVKLSQGDYPQEIIEDAIQYVKSYRYVDDVAFASRYIEFRQESKNRQILIQELRQKGISKEDIQAAFDEKEPVDESEMIRKWIEKKRIDPETAEPKEKQKLYQFLLRKGFSYSEISKVIREDYEC